MNTNVFNIYVCFTGKKYVNKIDVFITNKYLEGTFNSCSKVSVPSTGQLAMDIMCGIWGASRCTPMKWFHYMGDAENNGYVPFQITYKNTDVPVGNFTPVDPIVTPCSKALNVSNELNALNVITNVFHISKINKIMTLLCIKIL